MKKIVRGFNLSIYIKEVYTKCLIVGVVSFFLSFTINNYFQTPMKFIISPIIYIIITSTTILTIGLNKNERKNIANIITNKISYSNK